MRGAGLARRNRVGAPLTPPMKRPTTGLFETVGCQRDAALPYTGRMGVEDLPKFLANLWRYNPTTAMTFPSLRSKKDIGDMIAYTTGSR
jgi:cytochrome c2